MKVRSRSLLVFACHDASCRPPTSGGTGGSKGGRKGGLGTGKTMASTRHLLKEGAARENVHDVLCSPPPCSEHSLDRQAKAPGRAALHDMIIEDALKDVPKAEGQPVLLLMGGGGGSGKTTVLKSGVAKAPGTPLTVNADDIKEKLPEYHVLKDATDSRAAAYVHEESSALSKRLLKEGMDKGVNIVLDQVGSNPDKVRAVVAQAKAAGYAVHGVYVDVHPDTAVARASSRAKRTGRVVPEAVLRQANADARTAYHVLKSEGIFDSLKLVDNNGDIPKVVNE